MTSALVDLATERDWDPARLAAAEFAWPKESESFGRVRLSEVVRVVSPDSWAGDGTLVITPASLDPIHGGILRRSHKYQGSTYTVTADGRGLHPLDLLVPPSANTPLLMVAPQLVGSSVSGRFLAVRPVAAHAYWLWGLLCSQHGQVARAHAAAAAQGIGRPALDVLDLEIPWPSIAVAQALESKIAKVEAATHREEEAGAETWWRVTTLASADWQLVLASPRMEQLQDGEPLGDLCQDVLSGRLVRQLVEEASMPGLMPVADMGVLSGKGTTRWTDPETRGTAVAEVGDVLIASVGNRPYAAVATEPAVLHENVFALRMHNRQLGPAIVRYLNGAEGYALRQAYLTGATVPHLNKTNLRRIPIPPSALAPERTVEHLDPLAQQLEQLLWT